MNSNLLSPLLSIVLACAPAFAFQTPDKKPGQETIRISAELVQIDVVVTDRAGKPVRGLRREDFELLDNNKPQFVTHFSYEETRSRQVEEDTEQLRTLPRAITAKELKRVLAFVVDTMHMKPENLYRTQKMIEDFIEQKMEPGDLVLILATGGGSGLYQQFTSDQRLLRGAVSKLRPFIFSTDTAPRRSLPSPGPLMGGVTRGPVGSLGGPPPLSGYAGGIDPLEEYDIRATLFTLNNVIRSMKKLPGRKLSVFISEGFRASRTQTTMEVSNTAWRAAQAGVVFYTIDPRGLDPLGLGAADDPGEAGVQAFLDEKRSDYYESQDPLNAIALDTGGRFYRNSNDIKRGLNSLLEENSGYYLLGFQPDSNKWDGKFHKLKVVARGRPDLAVSTRRGYLAKSEPPPAGRIADPKLAEMSEAINSPLVRRDIDLRLTPFYRDNDKREPVLFNLLHIDISKLGFKQVDGRYKARLELSEFVIDSNGRAVDRFSNVVETNMTRETYDEAMKRGLLSTRTLDLKPGVYQIRAFVRDTESGLIGTAYGYVEVPDMKGSRLATSSIFAAGWSVNDGKPADGEGEGGTLAQRRFKRGGQFGYRLVIFNARVDEKTKQPQLEAKARVLLGRQVVFNGTAKPVEVLPGSTPPSRIVTGGTFQLGEIAAGEYTLEVTVIDRLNKKQSRGVVRQEIDFTVE